jgi:hypothetical protein
LRLRGRAQSGFVGERPLEAAAGDLVELAVDIGHQHLVGDSRHQAASSFRASAWRPRTSREVSVPIGTSRRSAASR